LPHGASEGFGAGALPSAGTVDTGSEGTVPPADQEGKDFVGTTSFVVPNGIGYVGMSPSADPDGTDNVMGQDTSSLDHVKATSHAVPALTLDVVADDTVDNRMANSNLHRKPPNKVKHSTDIKKELAAIDRTIMKNTRDFERIGKMLRQPSGLSTEQVASLQREQASSWKANETLRATRARVLERGNPAAMQ
jgi:hypothetical protein